LEVDVEAVLLGVNREGPGPVWEALVPQLQGHLLGNDAAQHPAQPVLLVAAEALHDRIQVDPGLPGPLDGTEGIGQACDGGGGKEGEEDGKGQGACTGEGGTGGSSADAAGIDDAVEVDAVDADEGAADGLAAHAGGLAVGTAVAVEELDGAGQSVV